MSHFTVGVIVQDPADLERALAPYGECCEDYYERVEYMSLNDYIHNYREYGRDEADKTDEEIIKMAHEEYNDIEDGMIYIHYNPNAKWDWWSIGGRWRYKLRTYKNLPHIKDRDFFVGEPLKQKGKYRWCDGAKIKDIHLTAMNKPKTEDLKYWSRFWDVVVEGQPPEEGETFHNLYSSEYYRNMYQTKENYIMKQSLFLTHALLDSVEGEWYEQGQMGWFGITDATQETMEDYATKFYNILRDPAYQDYWFIVVDCHI